MSSPAVRLLASKLANQLAYQSRGPGGGLSPAQLQQQQQQQKYANAQASLRPLPGFGTGLKQPYGGGHFGPPHRLGAPIQKQPGGWGDPNSKGYPSKGHPVTTRPAIPRPGPPGRPGRIYSNL